MHKKRFYYLKNNKGFTLAEIMIALILVVGAGAAVLSNVAPKMEKGKVRQAKIMLNQLADAVETFYMDCSYYPSSLEELVTAPGQCESWGPEPYLKNGKIPKDPWKSDFIYTTANGSYEIISLGKDRKQGGEKFSTDISSKDL